MLQVLFNIKLDGVMLGCLNVFIHEDQSLKDARGQTLCKLDYIVACSRLPDIMP